MQAYVLVVPVLMVRLIFLGVISKKRAKRARFLAPLSQREVPAYVMYQISTVAFIVFTSFQKINIQSDLYLLGMMIYSGGLLLLIISTLSYSNPEAAGVNTSGIYQVSRNPMYLSNFILYLGIVLLVQSWALLLILGIYIMSSHWVILAEEKWCIEQYGTRYTDYMEIVRRYI